MTPGVSVSPWTMTEQNTVNAARLKIRSPAGIPSASTSRAKVIVATPFGPDWYPYLMRRLAERPANLLFFVRSAIRR